MKRRVGKGSGWFPMILGNGILLLLAPVLSSAAGSRLPEMPWT